MTLRPRLVAIALSLAVGCTASSPDAVGTGLPERPPVVLAPAQIDRPTQDFGERSLPPPSKQVVAAPMSLTASDGTGLRLVALDAKAFVQEPLAFTELHLTFDNPESRQIEGQFQIDLPPGAAISRFAMKIGGQWQEGEVVERQAARMAYEDFLHRRQDPALLEKQAGNRFSARVFPIPALGRKELIVSYSQPLTDSGEPYRLLLAGLPKLDQLDVAIAIDDRAGGAATSLGGAASRKIEIHETQHVPHRDLELQSQAIAKPVAVRHGDLAVARISAAGQMPPEPIPSLTILFDTSASRALGFDGQVRRLGELVHALGQASDFPLRVVAFDQSASEIYSGKARGFGAKQLEVLYARRAFGATDLTAVMRQLATGGSSARLLVVSDGILTAGKDDPAALRAAIGRLGEGGLERLDALIDGGLQDREALRGLTGAGLLRHGVVVDARLPASEIAQRLTQATLSNVRVDVPGASWVWPNTLDGVQPGDEVLVFAQLPENQAMTVALGKQGTTHRLEPVTVEKPLLERAWVGARIDALTAQLTNMGANEGAEASRLKQQIVELSVRHRVLSDFTALLVLETEDDYARFKIDRNALADILTVGPRGVERLHRKPVAFWGPGADTPTPFQSNPTLRPEEPVPSQAPPADAMDDVEGGVPSEPPAPAPAMEAEPAREMAAAPKLEEASKPAPSKRASKGVSMPTADSEAPVVLTPEQMERIRVEQERRLAEENARRQEAERLAREAERTAASPYEGKMYDVMSTLQAGRSDEALTMALAWHDGSPGDILALIALGEVLEAQGKRKTAARVYGSLIDLFPARADLRRFAGERLERLQQDGLTLAVDTFREAVEQRPDHPSSHRLFAFALLRSGDAAGAFAAIEAGTRNTYPSGRFAGVDRILREDMGLIAAAWIARDPSVAMDVQSRLAALGATIPVGPSIRFVLNWETDANDVDFHIYDAQGGHAYYSNRTLPSGGELYADVTTGYGPECFTIAGKATAFPYRLEANYYSRGPMGYGMGKVQIIAHDGQGGLAFEDRPFVIMKDHAAVALGEVPGPLQIAAPASPTKP